MMDAVVGLVGPLPALPEAMLTYLFETKLAAVSFSGGGGASAARPEAAVLFGLLFVHVNGRTKVCVVAACVRACVRVRASSMRGRVVVVYATMTSGAVGWRFR